MGYMKSTNQYSSEGVNNFGLEGIADLESFLIATLSCYQLNDWHWNLNYGGR